MADNISNILEKLQSILGDQSDGGDGLKNLLGELTGGSSDSTPSSPSVPDSTGSDINPEMLIKIKRVYDRLNNRQDPRVSLLTALKPYLNSHRANQVDSAVKMLNFTKLSSIMKEFD